MEKDNIYEKLKTLLAKSGGNFSILEEQIDIELQVDFYQLVNQLKKENRAFEDVVLESNNLYSSNTSIENKKRLIAELSNIEKVEAYRLLEKFIDKGDANLRKWAMLALQHCRVGLETHLLDGQQVFISTGLGGKKDKLRYFIVGKLNSTDEFNDTQKKVIQSEFNFSFNTFNSIIEKISFFNDHFTVIGLIPIDVSINDVIRGAIEESNNYGGFLHKEFLVTNVKILTIKEISHNFKKKGLK